MGAPVFGCRCVACPRCGHHTGNSTQGHYWRLCTRSGRMEEFHLCCPGDCELAPAKPEPARGTWTDLGNGRSVYRPAGSDWKIPPDALRPYLNPAAVAAVERSAAFWDGVWRRLHGVPTVHACPPPGAAAAPCCGRNILELPRTDRVTDAAGEVTCGG